MLVVYDKETKQLLGVHNSGKEYSKSDIFPNLECEELHLEYNEDILKNYSNYKVYNLKQMGLIEEELTQDEVDAYNLQLAEAEANANKLTQVEELAVQVGDTTMALLMKDLEKDMLIQSLQARLEALETPPVIDGGVE